MLHTCNQGCRIRFLATLEFLNFIAQLSRRTKNNRLRTFWNTFVSVAVGSDQCWDRTDGTSFSSVITHRFQTNDAFSQIFFFTLWTHENKTITLIQNIQTSIIILSFLTYDFFRAIAMICLTIFVLFLYKQDTAVQEAFFQLLSKSTNIEGGWFHWSPW